MLNYRLFLEDTTRKIVENLSGIIDVAIAVRYGDTRAMSRLVLITGLGVLTVVGLATAFSRPRTTPAEVAEHSDSPRSLPTLGPTQTPAEYLPAEEGSPSPAVLRETFRSSSVAGIQATPTPAPRPTATPTPIPTPTATPEPITAPRLSFVNLPRQVPSGEQFTVAWRIDGSAGSKGETTTVEIHQAETQGGSSSKNNIRNSFGSFTIPATFSTKLRLGGSNSSAHITATATVNGQTITETAEVQLTR
jgi:hypothetical protein